MLIDKERGEEEDKMNAILNMEYRSKQLDEQRKLISLWKQNLESFSD